MNKTKIDWATMSWNPVTGCRHGCPYCYARRTAHRFDTGCADPDPLADGLHVLEEKIKATPYPYGFEPTMHRYRLNQPERQAEPQTIFVCSMADLFGRWVPTSWIAEVLDACRRAPQHRYLFLTKNPERYGEWIERFETCSIDGLDEVENCWFGASASNNAEFERANRSMAQWISIEPIRERIETDEDQFMEFNPYTGSERKRWAWVVIGAETGNSKNKVAPKREWIDDIATACADYGTPVFMKESLRDLMGDDFRQEFPWEV